MEICYLIVEGCYNKTVSKLFIVATPIGNLGDITKRALETLESVDVVLAEDTRVTEKLLKSYELRTKRLVRYDQHSFRNEAKKLEILNWLMQGKNIALVTDAGTPGISDPGNELLDWLYEQIDPITPFQDDSMGHSGAKGDRIQVVPVPGASSVTAALSVCGFDVSSYLFAGFLPKKKKSKIFDQIKSAGVPVVFFESPFRIIKTLQELSLELGEDKRIFIGRELTKLYEEHFRGTLKEVLLQLDSKNSMKGEFVCVLEV